MAARYLTFDNLVPSWFIEHPKHILRCYLFILTTLEFAQTMLTVNSNMAHQILDMDIATIRIRNEQYRCKEPQSIVKKMFNISGYSFFNMMI